MFTTGLLCTVYGAQVYLRYMTRHSTSVPLLMSLMSHYFKCIIFHQFKVLPIKPPNFTWVIAEKICALGFPGDPANLAYLQENGITHLISLTAEREPPYEHVKRKQNFSVILSSSNCTLIFTCFISPLVEFKQDSFKFFTIYW